MSILDLGKNEKPFVTSIRIPDEDRNRINRDIEKFIAKGGKIQQIPTGQSAYNFTFTANEKGNPIYDGLNGREYLRSVKIGKSGRAS